MEITLPKGVFIQKLFTTGRECELSPPALLRYASRRAHR